MKKTIKIFILSLGIFSAGFIYADGNRISDPTNPYNRPAYPRYPKQNFPCEKPTKESFWRVYRKQAEVEIRLFRTRYPNITFDNMGEYLSDPEVAQFYYGIAEDYKTWLLDPRHPVL